MSQIQSNEELTRAVRNTMMVSNTEKEREFNIQELQVDRLKEAMTLMQQEANEHTQGASQKMADLTEAMRLLELEREEQEEALTTQRSMSQQQALGRLLRSIKGTTISA